MHNDTTPAPAPRGGVQVDAITKRYGRTLALDNVSLSIPPNQLFALLGPNGAGKTTLLHILCTILQPDSGTATLAGFDVVRQPVRARRNLGVVFQEPSLDDRLTVAENLDFHGLVYQVPRKERRQAIVDMLELVELTQWRDHLVRALSSGMKRRLEIARALLHSPKIIFLDEPTVGLDAQSRERIWTYLDNLRRQRDLTIVVTTHYIEEVENCDSVCIIDHGKILTQGTPEALKAEHGQEVIRVIARSDEIAADITAQYPQAKKGQRDTIVIPVSDAGFSDRFMAQFGNKVRQIAFDRPTLEDVFLSLTGRDLRDKAADDRERTYAAGKRGGEGRR